MTSASGTSNSDSVGSVTVYDCVLLISETICDVSSGVVAQEERCIRESTAWSACSVTCGMGVSMRVTNDNEQCQSQQQRRLCLIRPCDVDDEQFVSSCLHSVCVAYRQ